jgi:hypothetical protein
MRPNPAAALLHLATSLAAQHHRRSSEPRRPLAVVPYRDAVGWSRRRWVLRRAKPRLLSHLPSLEEHQITVAPCAAQAADQCVRRCHLIDSDRLLYISFAGEHLTLPFLFPNLTEAVAAPIVGAAYVLFPLFAEREVQEAMLFCF